MELYDECRLLTTIRRGKMKVIYVLIILFMVDESFAQYYGNLPMYQRGSAEHPGEDGGIYICPDLKNYVLPVAEQHRVALAYAACLEDKDWTIQMCEMKHLPKVYSIDSFGKIRFHPNEKQKESLCRIAQAWNKAKSIASRGLNGVPGLRYTPTLEDLFEDYLADFYGCPVMLQGPGYKFDRSCLLSNKRYEIRARAEQMIVYPKTQEQAEFPELIPDPMSGSFLNGSLTNSQRVEAIDKNENSRAQLNSELRRYANELELLQSRAKGGAFTEAIEANLLKEIIQNMKECEGSRGMTCFHSYGGE